MKARNCFPVVLFVVLCLGITSCKSESAKTINIVLADDSWDSLMFHNSLGKVVMENAYDGYKVSLSTASSAMVWLSLKNNDVDLHLETWSDLLPTYNDDIKEGSVINVGVVIEDSCQGIYVPRYVVEGDPSRGIAPLAPGLRRVEDIIKYPHIFPDDENPSMGRFYGSIPGWTADIYVYRRFEYLGLDEKFSYVRLGSEAALFMSLVSAYNLGEPWVGYCYEPTWIVGKLDLIRLEDEPYEPEAYEEGKTGFSTQELFITCSREFPKKAPELLEFLKKYRTGSARLSEALSYIDETKASHDEAAVWFLKKFDSVIDEWLPAANAKKLRDYLSKK